MESSVWVSGVLTPRQQSLRRRSTSQRCLSASRCGRVFPEHRDVWSIPRRVFRVRPLHDSVRERDVRVPGRELLASTRSLGRELNGVGGRGGRTSRTGKTSRTTLSRGASKLGFNYLKIQTGRGWYNVRAKNPKSEGRNPKGKQETQKQRLPSRLALRQP
jgi:hypothetical protein